MPRRKSIRLKGWDYSSPGWYFLTITVKNMRPVFGTVVHGRMVHNMAGKIADRLWREIPRHFPHAVLDEFIVMPNHVHGLLQLRERGTASTAPLTFEAFGKPVAGSVSTIIRSYKAAVTRELGKKFWHGRFYDVRVRDDVVRNHIRRYIRQNPLNYSAVIQGTAPQCLGNRELLDMPKLGFLASRGVTRLHRKPMIQQGEVIISGFLSPMERALFEACLKEKRPMIWVKPWGIDGLPIDTAYRMAIEEGRLLIISPFDPAIDAPNARRAAWCNEYVLAHCNRLIIGHLNSDGMLACILSEASPELLRR
jgi:REP element-mobilizing transposase RayT